MFDCPQRRFWEPIYSGSDLNLTGWVKKITGEPTMTVGSIGLVGEAKCGQNRRRALWEKSSKSNACILKMN
jgi:hypothetical protein